MLSALSPGAAPLARGLLRSLRPSYTPLCPSIKSVITSTTSNSYLSSFFSRRSLSSHASHTLPKMSATPFLETLAGRRSIYVLKKESTISDERIQEIITEVIKHVPSSFNSQTTRVVLLVKEEHDKLWNIHKEVMKPIVGEDQWAATEQKLSMFQAAYGTVLFFDDIPSIKEMQANFALYADRFPLWAGDSNGAHQISTWAALEAEGLGGNLQHYNPLVDERVRETWDLPAGWALRAELVFGTPGGSPPAEKTFKPIKGDRLRVYGA